MADFADLIRHCDYLVMLLKNPHPGLITWQEQVQKEREFIWNYTGSERRL